MATVARRYKRSRSYVVHKATGQIHPRVQTVGPEHFGIVCIDGAKLRSKFILCDFFGNVLIPPTQLPHTRPDFEAGIAHIRQAVDKHQLHDLIIAIERTGTYHRPVQDAFRQAGWETRLVHPLASRQFRQPADPTIKTDDADLAAIFRAAVNGFGLVDPVWPDDYQQLQLFARHRRDLVRKQAKLRCQMRAQIHSLLPGFADCFEDLFDYPAAVAIACQTGSAQIIRDLGALGLHELVGRAGLRCTRGTLAKIVAWSQSATAPIQPIEPRRLVLTNLEDDRQAKNLQILGLERQLAHLLVRTPYVLLLAIPGLNVVSIAELAGELGPMTNYANANHLTGRAGLYPSRYQSDTVDRANGPIRRSSNRRLRSALIQIADNLIVCNHHFSVQALAYRQRAKDPRWIRVKVAKAFTRLAFAMVAGRSLFHHPCCQQRHYILDKLLAFHRDCDTPMPLVMQDLDSATAQLPRSSFAEEAQPLHERLRLGILVLPSTPAEELDPS
jgi:transposase